MRCLTAAGRGTYVLRHAPDHAAGAGRLRLGPEFWRGRPAARPPLSRRSWPRHRRHLDPVRDASGSRPPASSGCCGPTCVCTPRWSPRQRDVPSSLFGEPTIALGDVLTLEVPGPAGTAGHPGIPHQQIHRVRAAAVSWGSSSPFRCPWWCSCWGGSGLASPKPGSPNNAKVRAAGVRGGVGYYHPGRRDLDVGHAGPSLRVV